MNHGGVTGFSSQPVQLLLGTDPEQTLQLVLNLQIFSSPPPAAAWLVAVSTTLSIHRAADGCPFPRDMGSSAKFPIDRVSPRLSQSNSVGYK